MKIYLITGISGFVAQHFLNYLDTQGENIDVLGIARSVPPALRSHKFKHINLHCVELDLLDYRALEIALLAFSPEYIVHLASFSSVGKSWEMPLESFLNNTNIFLNIAEIIRKNALRCRMLSVGSSEEYGNVAPEMLPLKETLALNPVNPYAVARVSQEMLAQCYVKSYHLDILLTRSFNHIGTGQRTDFAVPSFVEQIRAGVAQGLDEVVLRTGDLSVVRDFIDVRDIVTAYDALLRKGEAGEIYNVCTGVGHTLESVVQMIARLFNIQVKIERDAARVRPSDNRIVVGDNTKIQQQTGWKPMFQLEETLRMLSHTSNPAL
jgi:GDP-4-dehydro-6-deoxy-D-mannose reductase